jgi:hypothetical protein
MPWRARSAFHAFIVLRDVNTRSAVVVMPVEGHYLRYASPSDAAIENPQGKPRREAHVV